MKKKKGSTKVSFVRILLSMLLFAGIGTITNAQITITGTVTDDANEPLIGVSVFIKGTNTGIITNTTGYYALSVPGENSVLVFSYIGYAMQEIQVGSNRTIDVELKEDVQAINEIVVLGYTKRARGELTGSVSNIKGTSIEAIPAGDLTKGLQGRLAGVTINDRGGEPGLSSNAEGNIRIRGSNTLGDNSPLIIIDGIPRSGLSYLSPNDIESISVLKDAS
ncbi:MAG: carboxypeptidase-like regulatory domain-containing protein, partial [Tannerellaceae bacterium]|nr:carboxypeptidase-like regulatory domain-containing protein [Tannerellaceae bacterium]